MVNLLQENHIEETFHKGYITSLIDYLLEAFPNDYNILHPIDVNNINNFRNLNSMLITSNQYDDADKIIIKQIKEYLVTKDIHV